MPCCKQKPVAYHDMCPLFLAFPSCRSGGSWRLSLLGKSGIDWHCGQSLQSVGVAEFLNAIAGHHTQHAGLHFAAAGGPETEPAH